MRAYEFFKDFHLYPVERKEEKGLYYHGVMNENRKEKNKSIYATVNFIKEKKHLYFLNTSCKEGEGWE